MEVDKTRSDIALDALARLICRLNLENLEFGSSSGFFESLGNEMQKCFKRPPGKPLCQNLKLTKDQWAQVENAADRMTVDYKKRAELLVLRLDVTIDSFFWSERIRNLESKVNAVYNPRRELVSEWQPLGVSDLLAATEDLLILEKASSYKQRIATKSKISNFLMAGNPNDRGGRTGEIIAPPRETFGGQKRARGGQDYRGSGHSRQDRGSSRQDRGGRQYSRGHGSGHRGRPY